MAVAVNPLYTDPQEIADYLYALMSEQAGPLGLAYVGYGDSLIPRYPAAIIIPGTKDKRVHTTHKFNVGLETFITVYHARLDINHQTRLREDLELVSGIEALIETDYEFRTVDPDRRVVFGYVSSMQPGTIMSPKGDKVVGTRMVVEVLTQQMF